MRYKPLTLFLVVLGGLLTLFFGCSHDGIVGGIEDVNTKIMSGLIYDENNHGADQALVMLIPADYNPKEHSSLPNSLIDTTNAQGEYHFKVTEKGIYNIYAVHASGASSLLIPGIGIYPGKPFDTLVIPADTLQSNGTIKIYLPDTVNVSEGYIFLQGTTIFVDLTQAIPLPGGGYLLIIDAIPEATYATIHYGNENDLLNVTPMSDIISVMSGDTAVSQSILEWNYFNTSDSVLLSNRVNDVYITPENQKWFATDYGAVTYDSAWTHYITDSTGIPSNIVLAIIQAHDGKMWFATDRGVAYFDNLEWKIFDLNLAGLPSNTVTTLAQETANNLIWIGMHDGIASYDGTEWTIYDSSSSDLYSYTIHDIAIDYNENKWFATNKGLVCFNGSKWKLYDRTNTPLPADTITCISVDNHGNLWIGYTGGLSRYDGIKWQPFNADNSPLLANTSQDIITAGSTLWLTTDKGMTRFDGNLWTDFVGEKYQPLENKNILTLALDKKGNVWTGTLTDGVVVFGPTAGKLVDSR